MNYHLVCLFVAVFSLISAENNKRDESCKTPDGKNGKCIPLNRCPAVYEGASSRNPTILNRTKASYCGYDEETLVCCERPGAVKSVDLGKGALPDTKVCGMVKEKPRIWGGQTTEIGEFPWMAGIYYKKRKNGEVTKNSLCGGSLINDEYILTAANCLISSNHEVVSVRLGEWDTSKDPDCMELVANKFCADPVKIIEVKEVIPHPLYSTTSGLNDIGLIRLKEKVKFTDFIAPVCLPHSKLPALEDNARLTVTGWGSTENSSSSDVLQKVELPLVSRKVCQERISLARKPLTLQQLCAGGEPGKDSCQGDAGGPLMRIYEDKEKKQPSWYQYGISSSGVKCGLQDYPGIYTIVSDYVDWIVNVISQS